MPRRLVTVLLVEDNAADAQATADELLFTRALRCELTHAARLSEAREAVASRRFDVLLLDLGLPDATGLDSVRALRAAAPDTAIVVLSGIGSEAVAVSALEAGAQDYLVKGRADADALQRSIRFAIARKEADLVERRFAAVVDSCDDAVLTTDVHGTITSFNGGAERLYGYARAEAVGQPITLLAPPQRRDEERELLARVRVAGGVTRHAVTFVAKDGTTKVVSQTISAIPGGADSVVGFSSIARDITEHTRAEAALRAVQEDFRVAFEAAPIGMALIGLDRRLTRVNPALASLLGYDAGELEGRSAAALSHPDDHGDDDEGLRTLLRGEATHVSAERRLVHATGHEVWVALHVTCVRAGDGSPQHFLAQMHDITDRRRYEERLQHLADHDPLTGLLNRRAFERALRDHVNRAERYGITGAALMIDLDHFKYYNDTLGHQAGDALIARCAAALAGRLRKSDVLARLGGDEFAVILPRADERAARQVVDGLLACVRGEGPAGPDGRRAQLTASIGVAFFADAGVEPEDVMVNADLAMYDAKEAGRDRASFYPAEPRRPGTMRTRVTWVEEIRAALAEERFELLAQPIVDLRGARPPRFELLLRMRTRDGDLVPPGTFLYVAERVDLVQEIDRWVVARALRTLAEHPAISLEINLSGKSIGAAALVAHVERLLHETGVDPGRLTFEITETAAVANIATARTFSERLRELGCRFALDDFGAGFGSFYYLKHLPFDYLKIDGEFVHSCATDATDRLLITAVVEIARGLGAETIAEFVGDEAGLATVRALGVDWGQGFHLGMPAPLAAQLSPIVVAGDGVDDGARP